MTSRFITSYSKSHVCELELKAMLLSSHRVGTDCATVTRYSLSTSTTRLIVTSIVPSVNRAAAAVDCG